MKNFIIVVETAFIAFIAGLGLGAIWEREKIEEESKNEENIEDPA